MHYYQFNIGDYAKRTRHLTAMEDLAYRRLLDEYYMTEKPLLLDVKKLSRVIGMQRNEKEVSQVLDDFFELHDDGYHQKRVDEEIESFKAKADVARENGRKGGRPKGKKNNPEETKPEPKKTQPVILDNPEETGSKAKHKPLNTNQEPLTKEEIQLSDESDGMKPKNQIEEIFDYWKLVMGKNTRTSLDPKRKKAIGARLKEGKTVDDIKKAIDGCSMTPHNMGQNENNMVYNDIELICRSASNLERFMDKVDLVPINTMSAKTQRNIATIQSWRPPE